MVPLVDSETEMENIGGNNNNNNNNNNNVDHVVFFCVRLLYGEVVDTHAFTDCPSVFVAQQPIYMPIANVYYIEQY